MKVITNKLKDCPFCGNRKVKTHSNVPTLKGLAMIVCDGCKATVSFGGKESEVEAIKAWNSRK